MFVCVSNSLAQGKAICEFHLVSFKVTMLLICCHPTKPKGGFKRRKWFGGTSTIEANLVFAEDLI